MFEDWDAIENYVFFLYIIGHILLSSHLFVYGIVASLDLVISRYKKRSFLDRRLLKSDVYLLLIIIAYNLIILSIYFLIVNPSSVIWLPEEEKRIRAMSEGVDWDEVGVFFNFLFVFGGILLLFCGIIAFLDFLIMRYRNNVGRALPKLVKGLMDEEEDEKT